MPFDIHNVPLMQRLEVLLLAVAAALGPSAIAHAANCVVKHTDLRSAVVSTSGVFLVRVYCPVGLVGCEAPVEATVSLDGTSVVGEWQDIGRQRNWSWHVFRPDAVWDVGSYVVSGLPNSIGAEDPTFEVETPKPSFSLDDASVEMTIHEADVPAGERICCPSNGEGDCEPSCGGADGARAVVEVRAEVPYDPTSVIWRIVDADDPEAAWMVDSAWQFDDSREQYCVRIDAWDTYDDSHQTFERCFEGDDFANAYPGSVEEDWSSMELGRCFAPPIVGGWGYDIWGVPTADDELPEAEEPLRQAFCEAKRAQCELPEAHAPEGGFERSCEWYPNTCPCYHFLHYCPDYVAQVLTDIPDAGQDDDAQAPTDLNEAANAGQDDDAEAPTDPNEGPDAGGEVERSPAAAEAKSPSKGCSAAPCSSPSFWLMPLLLVALWSRRRGANEAR